MSHSQTQPPNYPSLLYPNTNHALPQQTILPAVLSHGTGGNAADYMSKAVGGRKRRAKTIIRRGCGKCKKTRKCPRHKRRKTRKVRFTNI